MMNTGSLVLFFGIAGVVIVLGCVAALSMTRQMNGAVRTAAARLGAFFVEGGLFDEPQARFNLSGCRAWLRVFSGDRVASPFMRVVVDIRDRTKGTFSVEPTTFPESLVRTFSAPYLRVGDAAFDRDWIVQSVPSLVAGRVFAPARRSEAIATVLRLKDFNRPSIRLHEDFLVVEIGQYDADDEILVVLVKTAEEVLGYLLEAAVLPGITFGEVRLSSGGECPVCGSSMDEAVIRCEACRTPHHRECWQYMGRCTTYACKGRRFVA